MSSACPRRCPSTRCDAAGLYLQRIILPPFHMYIATQHIVENIVAVKESCPEFAFWSPCRLCLATGR